MTSATGNAAFAPVIGIVGGGQLARMLALAGLPLGMRFVFLDPAPDACAAVLGTHICSPFDDHETLEQLADMADVVTYEFESIPADAISFLAGLVPVYPSPDALCLSRDRLQEKNLLTQLGIPVAPFMQVSTREELEQAASALGLPAILKTRTQGYDGKGQAVLRQPGDLDDAWQRLGGVPLVLEKFVAFNREVSIIAVRNLNGEIAFYPLSDNEHRDGILHFSRNLDDDALQPIAEEYARRLLEHFGYIGVMALELFDTDQGLLANEMAPRVHNSGHWTIEGSLTSQFENHLRAITGLPLGSTRSTGKAAMVNFIGDLPPATQVLALPGATLHAYGKSSRPGRKVGHATLHSGNSSELQQLLQQLLAIRDGSAVSNGTTDSSQPR